MPACSTARWTRGCSAPALTRAYRDGRRFWGDAYQPIGQRRHHVDDAWKLPLGDGRVPPGGLPRDGSTCSSFLLPSRRFRVACEVVAGSVAEDLVASSVDQPLSSG